MSNNDVIKPLADLLEFNKTTKKRSCEFRQDKIQQLRAEEVQRSGLYLMWDPVEERWVYMGEAENLAGRWREHLNWQSYLFTNIGHALAHSWEADNLIPLLNKPWKDIRKQSLDQDFHKLLRAIQTHVNDWCVTWVPTPSREIGLRRFLEADMIAALSGAHATKDSWLGPILFT